MPSGRNETKGFQGKGEGQKGGVHKKIKELSLSESWSSGRKGIRRLVKLRKRGEIVGEGGGTIGVVFWSGRSGAQKVVRQRKGRKEATGGENDEKKGKRNTSSLGGSLSYSVLFGPERCAKGADCEG